MAISPFAPTAPAPVPVAVEVETTEVTETATNVEKKRKRNAKPLSADQYKEIIERAKNGETPKETADAMNIERNQAYNFVRKYKTTLQEVLDNDESTADQKEKAQKGLDLFPVREFGNTAGEKRVSSSATAISDLLAEAGLA